MLTAPQAIVACIGSVSLIYGALAFIRARILGLSLKGSREDRTYKETKWQSLNHREGE